MECEGIRFFMSIILVIFLALFLWAVSPVGILFFSSVRILFSKSSSMLKRKLAWIAQIIAFLTWGSIMFLLLVVYIDSVSYKVLNLGGDVLNLAIISGCAFFIVMILVIFVEKMIYCNTKKNENNNSKNNSKKIKSGGIKQKVKRKIKKEIKEIINDKIDKL
ncbi:hypothetical protein KAI56_02470 [Candidatus Parcubacteria bacterium]|nr:hypothetical protein [Candidatus Parcubacteria bacterium]